MSTPSQAYDRALARNVTLKKSYLDAYGICAIMLLHDSNEYVVPGAAVDLPELMDEAGILLERVILAEQEAHGDILSVHIPDRSDVSPRIKARS